MLAFIDDYQAVISLVLLAILFAGFVMEALPPSAVAACGAAAFLLLGYIDFSDFLGVFSNSAPITIAAMFVLSGALLRTGLLEAATSIVVSQGKTHPVLAICLIMLCAAIASAFVNNTPVVLVLIPIVFQLARSLQISPTRLLIPLSYMAILGGTSTLVGTSTNLLVAGIAQRSGLEPFTIFEITPVGLVAIAVGSLTLLSLGPLLLPHRQRGSDILGNIDDERFFTSAVVRKGADCIGQPVGKVDFLKPDGVSILALRRGGTTFRRDLDSVEIRESDMLILSAQESEILAIKELPGIDVGQTAANEDDKTAVVVKAFVAPSRRGQHRRLTEQWEMRRSGIRVLGVNRHRHLPGPDLGAVILRPADRLLIKGVPEAIARIGETHDLINIAETSTRPFRRAKAPIALGTLVLVVGLAAFDVLPIGALAILGVALILLTRCIDASEAWDSINLDLLVLIFSMLAIGVGLEKTGALKIMIDTMTPLLQGAPYLLVVLGLYALTSFLTEIATNNAVAVVATPLAISLAHSLDVDARPLVIAIMFGASASFATPIGYQTNTLVYGAADYRFTDFLKIGIPHNIIVGGVTCLAIAYLMTA